MNATGRPYGHRHAPSYATTIVTITSGAREDLEKQRRQASWRASAANTTPARAEGRAQPIIALVCLIFLLLATAAGITLFVLGLAGVTIARASELPSRIVVFLASVVGFFYVFVHLFAARSDYRKPDRGVAPHLTSYLPATAILLVRLEIPIWITAIATTALSIATIGGALHRSFVDDPKQMVYVNLLVSVVGLLADVGLLVCVESSMTPFATALVSRTDFLTNRGLLPPTEKLGEDDTEDPTSPQSMAQRASQHRSLNSFDRANGAWPIQNAPARAPSSIYSTHPVSRGSMAAASGFPRTPVGLPIAPPTIPPDVEDRSPVHMSWRPPSHSAKSSLDYGRRQSSRLIPFPAPTLPLPAHVQGSREPTLPTVLPPAAPAQTQVRPRTAGSTRTTTSTRSSAPSPRSRSLRSHPPFSVPDTPLAPSKPMIGLPQSVRPQTAPGLPSGTLGLGIWSAEDSPFRQPSIKRKPVGAGSIRSVRRPSVTDDDYSSVISDFEDDDEDDGATTTTMRREPSRTAKRVQKERSKSVKRTNTSGSSSQQQNFSRPLLRSKSLSTMHGRTVSELGERDSVAFFNGDFRYHAP